MVTNMDGWSGGWMDGWRNGWRDGGYSMLAAVNTLFTLADCRLNQSQTFSIYGRWQKHINTIHDFTAVNAKQMYRNLEGSRQILFTQTF